MAKDEGFQNFLKDEVDDEIKLKEAEIEDENETFQDEEKLKKL